RAGGRAAQLRPDPLTPQPLSHPGERGVGGEGETARKFHKPRTRDRGERNGGGTAGALDRLHPPPLPRSLWQSSVICHLVNQLPHHAVAQRPCQQFPLPHYGPGDILLDNRIISFATSGTNAYYPEINDLTAILCTQQLLYLQSENPNQEIPLYINTPGANVS